MNRRGFLGTLLGVAAAIVAPFTAAKPSAAAEMLTGWKTFFTAAKLNQDWLCVVHPSIEADIRTMAARSKWQAAWHHARTIGIGREATPQHILHVFREYRPFKTVSESSGYHVDNCGIGHFENIRFVTSRVDAPDTLDGKQVS